MAEYIDREAVMKIAKDGNHSDFGRSMADLTSLREVLEDTPTADVESVVRCRDCKYYEKKTGYCLKNSYFKDSDGMSCSPADSPDFTFFNEDDFCSYGKTKDGETE